MYVYVYKIYIYYIYKYIYIYKTKQKFYQEMNFHTVAFELKKSRYFLII